MERKQQEERGGRVRVKKVGRGNRKKEEKKKEKDEEKVEEK